MCFFMGSGSHGYLERSVHKVVTFRGRSDTLPLYLLEILHVIMHLECKFCTILSRYLPVLTFWNFGFLLCVSFYT